MAGIPGGVADFKNSVHTFSKFAQAATGSGALAGTPYAGALQQMFNGLGPGQKDKAIQFLANHGRDGLLNQLLGLDASTGTPQQGA